MEQVCHYDVLGVPVGASGDEIAAAYTRGLQRLRQAIADGFEPPHDKLDAMRAAYAVLSEPEARQRYDAERTAAAAPPAPPVVAAPAAGGAQAPASREAFRFTGAGGEYFRIWIVNLMLTILTLGIYAPWAKVRREKYFHQNLLLDGAGFDYHGDPKAIFKGRMVAGLLFLLLSGAQKVSDTAYVLALLAVAPLVPWLAVRAMRFRAHNTSYRGLRFGFDGSYGAAAKAFLGYGLLTVVTLGIAFPAFLRAQKRFVLNHLRYGSARFEFDAATGAFYRMLVLPGLLALGIPILLAIAIPALGTLLPKGKDSMALLAVLPLLTFIFFFAVWLFIGPYLAVRTSNLVWNHTHLGGMAFVSELKLRRYLGLTLGNWLLLLCTLGFYRPWAVVRLARYRAEQTAVVGSVALGDFVAGEVTKASAIGDQAAEIFDIDVAL